VGNQRSYASVTTAPTPLCQAGGLNNKQVQIPRQWTGSTRCLPHVFERFYRVDRSRSRSEGGSGLGLSIARQLAEAHGGSLTVANHPLGGAVFILILPKNS
jgi:signal transduction histidine kinase